MRFRSREVTTSLLFLVVFSAGFSLKSFGQKAAISGKVITTEDEPVVHATVAVYDSTAENLLTGTQTDNAGSFQIQLDPGTYLLRVTFISYDQFEKVFTVEAGEARDFSAIKMSESQKSLEDIDVEGQRSQMQMNFDKRIFAVGTDVTTVGGSALDVLDNVPSITTDIEGNISLRGSEGVRILINGKPSSTYNNDSGALRGLSANMIEEIEVITNPSARYEAEGSAGIINIILKKNEDEGLNARLQKPLKWKQE